MVYLLKMVILLGYVSHNQMVYSCFLCCGGGFCRSDDPGTCRWCCTPVIPCRWSTRFRWISHNCSVATQFHGIIQLLIISTDWIWLNHIYQLPAITSILICADESNHMCSWCFHWIIHSKTTKNARQRTPKSSARTSLELIFTRQNGPFVGSKSLLPEKEHGLQIS